MAVFVETIECFREVQDRLRILNYVEIREYLYFIERSGETAFTVKFLALLKSGRSVCKGCLLFEC